MFKTETLTAFSLVAKHGSFTQAAEEQQQTPMALSKQVSLLEKRLGTPLFERSTRKIKLTEFGQAFLAKVQNILVEHDALQSWLDTQNDAPSGILLVVAQDVLTYEETIYPWLAEFHSQYPNICVSLDVRESVIDIEQHPCDIYWGVGDYLGDKYPGLKRRSLWKTHLGIFASPAYLEKFGTPKKPADLVHHRMISHPHQQPDNAIVVNRTANSHQVEMEFELLNASIKTVSGHSKLAVQGIGLINALADNHDIKSSLAKNELKPVLEPYWFANAEVYIYYHQVKLEQAKVRAFIDFFLSKRKLW